MENKSEIRRKQRNMAYIGSIFMVIFSIALVLAITPGMGIHPFGAIGSQFVPTDTYYIKYAVPQVGAYNVVCSIVFDYRGYDTLGEATVLFTALAGAAALLLIGVGGVKGGKR